MNSIKTEIKSHLVSTLFFTSIFAVLIFISINSQRENPYEEIETLLSNSGLSLQEEIDRAVIIDGLKNYFADKKKSEKLLEKMEKYKTEILTGNYLFANKKLTFTLAFSVLMKWLKFLFLFAVSSLLLFYFSEAFALLKLKLKMLGKSSFINNFITNYRSFVSKPAGLKKEYFLAMLKSAFLIFAKILAYAVFFSPVYIVAYVFKFNYGNVSTLAFIVLTLFTNGMLAISVNKFYLLLQSEMNKGYVETDKIKGLRTGFSKEEGITFFRIFSLRKNFGNHILKSVYKNAHRQFIYDFKEVSRFLITGIIIVELSLNIQNGFFYEMLQALMQNRYDLLLFTLALVFLAVKSNDFAIIYFAYKENLKYENK